jgi:hypothetical protein
LNPSRWTLAALAAGLVAFPSIVQAQYAPGKGSLGGSLGVPRILATGELKQGQKPRIIGKAHFQYVMDHDWRLSLRGGFGWLGYSDEPAPFVLQAEQPGGDPTRGDQLLIFNPFTAVLAYTPQLSANWQGFVGVGPGAYRINIQNDHRTIFDPVTKDRYKFGSFGASAEAGAEYFLPANRNVSLEGVTTFHYLFSDHKDRFPSGYSGKHMFADVSIGVNVYFRPLGSPAPPSAIPSEGETGSEAPADTSASQP